MEQSESHREARAGPAGGVWPQAAIPDRGGEGRSETKAVGPCRRAFQVEGEGGNCLACLRRSSRTGRPCRVNTLVHSLGSRMLRGRGSARHLIRGAVPKLWKLRSAMGSFHPLPPGISVGTFSGNVDTCVLWLRSRYFTWDRRLIEEQSGFPPATTMQFYSERGEPPNGWLCGICLTPHRLQINQSEDLWWEGNFPAASVHLLSSGS